MKKIIITVLGLMCFMLGSAQERKKIIEVSTVGDD